MIRVISMALDATYFATVQGALGTEGESEFRAAWAQDELLFDFEDSINYVSGALRNGESQPMIITGTEVHNY